MANYSIEDYAKAINTSWRKTTENIFETARLCAEADKLLSKQKHPQDKKLSRDTKLPLDTSKFFNKLELSKATFSKLVKIGSHPQLQTDPLKSLLPPNYSIVYEVAKLSDKDLQLAINDGVINPKMSRAELESWIAGQRGQISDSKNEDDRIIATVCVPADFDEDKVAKLQEALNELEAQFGVAVQRPRDAELDELNRMMRKIDDYIRKGARLYIRKLKSKRLAGQRNLTPAIRKRLWPYSDEKVEISPEATWEQVISALDTVGSADQFERLRDEALRLHGVPEKNVREHPAANHEEAMEELKDIMAQHAQTLPHKLRQQRKLPDTSNLH